MPPTPLQRVALIPLRLLLFNFLLVYRSSHWLRRRFTAGGRFALSTLLAAAAIGIDTRLNVAHQLFALLAALLLLALLAAPLFRPRLAVRRILPRYGSVGAPLEYRLEVHNQGRRLERGLAVQEELETPPPGVERFFRFEDPARASRSRFDRFVGYPRWAWMMRLQAGAWEPARELPPLPPHRFTEVRLALTPLRRGAIRFRTLRIARADPLGLFNAFRSFALSERLLILPRRYPLPRFDLPGGRRLQPGGVSLASQIGESDEFVSLREYRPGDPLRHIHWKSLAHTGRPIVKEFQDEFFARHALALDTCAAEGDAAFEEAVSVAASFIAAIDTHESLLDLLFIGNRVEHLTAGRGVAQNDHLLEVLACLAPAATQDFQPLAEALMRQAGRLSGVICVLLAWDEPRRELIRRLRTARVSCLVLVISSSLARLPADPGPMADQPHRFHLLAPGEVAAGLRRLGRG